MSGAGAEIRLERVSVRFGSVPALGDVSLALSPGESLALVGPSGAGKTTLLRLCNGTLRPTAGRVLVDGVALAALAPRALRRVRARIAYVHQDLALVPNVRVLHNVLAGRLGRQSLAGSLRSMTLPRRHEVERVHGLLERVGIGGKIYERTDRLSGGERQRVAVARALYQDPVALLADEPVSSVDPARARDTVELLARISREDGLTLCMSLHALELARLCFPRLVGLREGRIAFDRDAAAVDEHEFGALYALGAGPSRDGS